MKLTTILLVVAGAGVAYYLYRRATAPSGKPLAGTPLEDTIFDPESWAKTEAVA